jgi:hypothetical protein
MKLLTCGLLTALPAAAESSLFDVWEWTMESGYFWQVGNNADADDEILPTHFATTSGGGPRDEPGKTKKAARSIIPGKNPKTQREVQSDRLCLATRGRNHFSAESSKPFFDFFKRRHRPAPSSATAACGAGQFMRGILEESINPSDFSPSSQRKPDYSHGDIGNASLRLRFFQFPVSNSHESDTQSMAAVRA